MSTPRRSARNSSKRPNPEDNDEGGGKAAVSAAATGASKASDKRQKQEPKNVKEMEEEKPTAATKVTKTVVGKAEAKVVKEQVRKEKEDGQDQPKDVAAKKKGKKAVDTTVGKTSSEGAAKQKQSSSSKGGSKSSASKVKDEADEAEYPQLPAGLRVQKETSGKWLMKSEPDVFSLDDLYDQKKAEWDGVRNYTARNLLASMVPGDKAFFYHSNAKPPGIVGIMTIVEGPSLDETQFDPKHKYYDPKSSRASPRWVQVHVEPLRRLSKIIDLAELRSHSDGKLKDMMLFKQSRLSVSAVSQKEWDFILSLEKKEE